MKITNTLLMIAMLFQQITRNLIKVPIIKKVGWRLAIRLRRFFAKYNIKDFQTTFDIDIKIWVSLSDHIESQIFWQGVQSADRGEVDLLKSILEPEHIFFDIGANVGVFTLMGARRLTLGWVYAFEPSQTHLKRLRANLELNNFKNVTIVPFALSNTSNQKKDLYIPLDCSSIKNTGRASLYPQKDFSNEYTVESVLTLTLDDYVLNNGVQRVDVIKIDVEGSEMDILEGGRFTINKFRPMIMMEVNKVHLQGSGRSLKELIEFYKSLDYKIFRILDNGKLLEISQLSEFTDSQNIFCCHYSRSENIN